MDATLFMEYAWILLVLVILEGILSADNALVLAVMVKHLPEEQRKRALFYGLVGAFVFRFATLFFISFLVDVWQVQALGAAYLLFMSLHHLYGRFIKKETEESIEKEAKSKSGFWMTVLKVELADIAFAIDSILAAVALAIAVTPLGLGTIGGLDYGQFGLIFAGGMIGIIIMRFAATKFIKILHDRPGLETAAFIIVGWVGVKLTVITLAHPSLGVLSETFAHSAAWKITFYAILVAIAVAGWFLSSTDKKEDTEHKSA